MKILFIVPKINNEGGVARTLSLRANFMLKKSNYEVHILTQNKGNMPLFYNFDPRIHLHDMSLLGNPIQFLVNYKKALKDWFASINPDVVFVLDNGIKSFLLPLLFKTSVPIILEVHGSKHVQEQKKTNALLEFIQIKIKEIGVKKYSKVIFLSKESAAEWEYKDPIVIPNPISFSSSDFSNGSSKKVIAVARHSYEKGLDRMINIWRKISVKYPDWHLEIYGRSNKNSELEKLVKAYGLSGTLSFFEPVKDISKKYSEASVFIMCSRFEGFPMVLLEAMSVGLPCVAYDCPIGPRAIIEDNSSGFLVEDGNEDLFEEKLTLLIENDKLRIKMGERAKVISNRYILDDIMNQWEIFLEALVLK